MSTFVLIPGAGGVAWYWHRVVPLLEDAGHEAIAVNLPGDDKIAGLPEYAREVVNAIGDRRAVVRWIHRSTCSNEGPRTRDRLR